MTNAATLPIPAGTRYSTFSWRYGKNNHEGNLYLLSDYDAAMYRIVPLKQGEVIYRFTTENMNGLFFPLIKVNADKKLAYFLTERAHDEDVCEFEGKGIKINWFWFD